MPDADISGFWKGLAVSRTSQTVVYLFLEQNGKKITGSFESPQTPSPQNKGDLTGDVNGSAVVLRVSSSLAGKSPGHASETIEFHGQVVGDPAHHMMHGAMGSTDRQSIPGGTITFFRPVHDGFAVDMYKA